MMRNAHLVLLVAVSVLPMLADAGDPPSRVARLNYQSGEVSFRPGSIEEWAPATINYPLTTGDHLWAGPGAQTELHIGSTAIRMGHETALSILNLDDRIIQLSLTAGTLNVHLRFLGEQESMEVDTPNGSVSLLRPGNYRLNVDNDGDFSVVTVRGGDAEVTAGESAFTVHPRQSARIVGRESASQDIGSAPPPDDFDRWCESRNAREERSQSARYVPREMIGYEDLDEFGAWRNVPPYGWVWAPTRVEAGWAPYHNGHWAWVEPWGWTWIDEAPWGFAPFHYGRWAFVAGGWIWAPGAMAPAGVAVVRPVYAPALVAFVGGPRFSLSIAVGGGGGVAAWFPLGPGEVYRPAYHVSNTYVQNVNVTHVTNVTNITNVNVTNVNNVRYVNQNVQGAVTAVPQQSFASARPVSQSAVAVPPAAMAQAQVVGSTAQVAPQRQSVLGHAAPASGQAVGQPGAAAAPPARFADRAVVAKSAPPPPPVSFAAKQQALQTNAGRPLAPNQMDSIRRTAPAPQAVRTVTPGSAPRPQAPVAPAASQMASPAGAPPRQPQPVNERPVSPALAPRPPQPNTERPLAPLPASRQPQPNTERPQPNNERPAVPAAAPRPAQPANDRPPAAAAPRQPQPVNDRPAAPAMREAAPPRNERPADAGRPNPERKAVDKKQDKKIDKKDERKEK